MTPIAELRDLATARTILGRAYLNEPLMRWIFPQPRGRADCIAAWLGVTLERYAAAGAVAISGDPPVAVAAYRIGAGDWPEDTLPSLDNLLAALIGPKRAEEVTTALLAATTLGPSEECMYLKFLAVGAGHQGTGHGSRLLTSMLAVADERGLPMKIETCNPVDVDFYRKFGFAVVGETTLGTDGPQFWAMWRPLPNR